MSAPPTIGRYEVLGPLASGGMAEILLARLRGPIGFERPVVLKRIAPHLASRDEFREMFVDEARLVSRLRHANVVHVYELGVDAGELFLAMEYLAGESLSRLMKRLAERDERLSPALIAHLVAEACAGLHAAHELRGDDGESLHVVHRDVSPQNLFLTYDGDVKLLDFGVAKAKNRLAQTATGQAKGKFAYMSPEQCRREPLDRTTDVFALGIVLFELLTARRLFRGNSELALVRAICDDPIPLATSVDPAVPDALEEVARKALAREPLDRYPTAAAMREALLQAARHLDPELVGRDDLGRVMRRLFADERREKDDALRANLAAATKRAADAQTDPEALSASLPDHAGRSRSGPVALPSSARDASEPTTASPARAHDAETVASSNFAHDAPTVATPVTRVSAQRDLGTPRWRWVAAAFVALLVAGGAAAYATSARRASVVDAPPPPPNPVVEAVSPPPPEPRAEPEPPPEVSDLPEPEPEPERATTMRRTMRAAPMQPSDERDFFHFD